MPATRKFNGETYDLHSGTSSRERAQKIAERARKFGLDVKVRKENDPLLGTYLIYVKLQ